MNRTEDRLRDAFRADAATITPETVRPLGAECAPEPMRAARDRAGRALRARRLAPLAAAAAVVAIVVTIVLAASPGGSPAPGAGPAAGASQAVPAPPFLVGTIIQQGHADLGVYDARTGKMTLLLPPQKGFSFTGAAATGNSHRFIVAMSGRGSRCYTDFLALSLTAQGRLEDLSSLAALRVRGTLMSAVTSLAASASGRVIGYSADACGSSGHGWIGVIRVAGTRIRTRTWPLNAEGTISMSMSASGRTLDFVDTSVLLGDNTVRSLPTDAPPGPVTQRARIVLPASSGVAQTGSAVLAGRGATLLACRVTGRTAVLARYDAVTGRELSVVHRWRHEAAIPCSVTVTPAGGDVIVADVIDHGIGIRIHLATGQARLVPSHGPHGGDVPDGLAW